MKKTSLILIIILMVTVILMTGCSGQKNADFIKIGAAGPYTGDLSKIGLDSLNAIKMAVEEINEAGGINGKKVEVAVGDDAGDPAKGTIVADKFISDPAVLGVVGPMNSPVANATLPTYDKAQLVLISQSATTSDLTDKGFKVMHRVAPRDDSQGRAAAVFISKEVKANKVYILDDKSTYGQGLADEVESNLKRLGVAEIKRDQVTAQDKDFSSIISLVKSFDPDLLYMAFANPAQVATLAKQAASVGLKPALMGGDGCREQDQLIDGGGEAVQGMYVTAIGRNLNEVPEAREFVKKFESQYGVMSIYSGQTYEATKILLKAIENADNAGELTREGVLKAVHSIKDFNGIMGFPVSFDDKGDLVGGEIFVLQVRGDDFSEVKKYVTGKIQ